jgi:hypothetical protein
MGLDYPDFIDVIRQQNTSPLKDEVFAVTKCDMVLNQGRFPICLPNLFQTVHDLLDQPVRS